MDVSSPPALLDRFARAAAKYIAHRATELRAKTALEYKLSGALARYWEAQARKAMRA